MLKMISWTQWLIGVSIITGLYYSVVTARYYKTELSAFFRRLARGRTNADTKKNNESKAETPEP